ncbi:polysaccharide biosynthesis protein [Nocardia callitridis]|uniref:Polysaccharide biosynthesis protein n=1 Tax=Nocardia callitridis TaxID=648753 RepID=A0ABP9JYC9_9NOCA
MSAARRFPVVADLTLVTTGAMTANVAGYLLQLLAGRWLGVTGYSEFASLLAVQLLCAVPAMALQNVVARELVRGAGVTALRALRWRCAVIVALVAVIAVPVVTFALHVGVAACAAALGAAPALVLVSGEQGVLQGSKRFRALAVVLGVAGVARVLPALVVLALGGGAAMALLAAAVGIAASAFFARRVAGSPRPRARVATTSTKDPNRPDPKPADALTGSDEPIRLTADQAGGAGTIPMGRTEDPTSPDADQARLTAESTRSVTASAAERARDSARAGGPVATPAASNELAGSIELAGSPTPDNALDPASSNARTAQSSPSSSRSGRSWAGVLPVLRAAQVQAALMALSSADLIVVRMVLDEVSASRYALGTIAAKIAFWLPQAVGVVLYPRMAQPAQSTGAIRSALAVLSGVGVVGVLGAALAAPLAPLFAGHDYAPIQNLLWLFAFQGAILAVLQGALLSAIAVDRTALAAVTWAGLGVEAVSMIAFARSVPTLIGTATAVAAVTTAVVATIVLRTADRADPLDSVVPVRS